MAQNYSLQHKKHQTAIVYEPQNGVLIYVIGGILKYNLVTFCRLNLFHWTPHNICGFVFRDTERRKDSPWRDRERHSCFSWLTFELDSIPSAEKNMCQPLVPKYRRLLRNIYTQVNHDWFFSRSPNEYISLLNEHGIGRPTTHDSHDS
jgi:hypothetical protein